jgi:hypothetical protein
MNFKEVDSSMVHAVGYDRKTKTLKVIFRSGKIWEYEGVPLKEYQALMKSGSIGSYMRECIIDCYSGCPERY